tara:strand:+ start:559 stop:1284 length:726 start_codon:yes stop_codon:yes gene_type:complete
MATTTIASEIQAITGVTTADANFIASGQKFIVANVPKNLLLFAQKRTSNITDGNGVLVNTDTITDVQRDGYSCRQISQSDSKWAGDSGSLKKATATHPVWFHSVTASGGDRVLILPDPDSGAVGHVFFIDPENIDDDSDLRNIIINYACFKEFAKLMMDSTHQGDFSTSAGTGGTEHWIVTEEDSEMLMARIQTIQAQLGEKTHYGQMAQQHYNLALAEIKSYIENHPLTLTTAMAMQGAR